MNDTELLDRIVVDPQIYGGKPIIRGNRMAVEHVLGMLGAGSSNQELLEAYEWLRPEDIQACLLYAARALGGERYQPRFIEPSA
jgi:uncharacterized protein (DUF433 family)